MKAVRLGPLRCGIHNVLGTAREVPCLAAARKAVVLATGSIALLADLIHNFGDALTAVPLGIAFVLRTERGEKLAGYFVALAISSRRAWRRWCDRLECGADRRR